MISPPPLPLFCLARLTVFSPCWGLHRLRRGWAHWGWDLNPRYVCTLTSVRQNNRRAIPRDFRFYFFFCQGKRSLTGLPVMSSKWSLFWQQTAPKMIFLGCVARSARRTVEAFVLPSKTNLSSGSREWCRQQADCSVCAWVSHIHGSPERAMSPMSAASCLAFETFISLKCFEISAQSLGTLVCFGGMECWLMQQSGK